MYTCCDHQQRDQASRRSLALTWLDTLLQPERTDFTLYNHDNYTYLPPARSSGMPRSKAERDTPKVVCEISMVSIRGSFLSTPPSPLIQWRKLHEHGEQLQQSERPRKTLGCPACSVRWKRRVLVIPYHLPCGSFELDDLNNGFVGVNKIYRTTLIPLRHWGSEKDRIRTVLPLFSTTDLSAVWRLYGRPGQIGTHLAF